LSGAGWNLVLVDRSSDDPAITYPLAHAEDLARVAADCGGPDRVVTATADVRDQAALDAAVSAGVDRFGGLDAVVSAAGAIAGGTECWRVPEEIWSAMVGINLEGPWRLARAAIPALLAQPEPRQGRFVAVASAGGLVGLPLLSAYAAAKHGLVGLIRSLAAELGPFGITANAVAPGSTDTVMLEESARVYGFDAVEEFSAHHLLRRLLQPREPAALVAWLCSPESSGVTGAVLPVDGGMTAQ
jgi:SDR family mycofactocin-dependent oxidoreductase